MTKNIKKPAVRFKEFTDAWEQRELGSISEKVTKKNQDMVCDEVFTNSAEYGIISQRDFFDKDIANSENIDGYYIVEPNDFVYNPRISNLAPFGPIRRNKLEKSGAMSPLYYVFRTHGVDYGFLEYYFKTNGWHSFMHLNGNSGARSDRFAIRDDIFKEMPITIPQNIVEQQAVGKYFTNLDNLITLHQRKCDTLQKLKKSMLQKMFPQNDKSVPEFRFEGFTDAWEQRKLEDTMEIVTDYVAAGSFADIADNVVYKSEPDYAQLIRTVDLKHNFCKNDFIYVDRKAFEYLWRVNLIEECIILPNIGANIGEVYYLEPSLLPYKNNVLGPNAIYLKPKTNVTYLFTQFQTYDFQNKLSIIVASSGQPKFNKTELKQIDFLVPNKEEQQKIGTFFKHLDNLITLHQRKLETLKKLKKSMLQKMFV